jgi:acyl-CoA synthetase (AMP-forming)/AMP-acid ligase II
MSADSEQSLSALLHESRRFDPPPSFVARANAQPDIYDKAAADPVASGRSRPVTSRGPWIFPPPTTCRRSASWARSASRSTPSQAIVAFVTVKGGAEDPAAGDRLVDDLRAHVAKEIGPIAKPRQILLTPELPKTRSGKIMRRLLRDVAEQRELGDVTTLLDPAVVNAIGERMVPGAEEREQA